MPTKRHRRRKVGALSGLWLLAGAIFGLCAALIEATSLIVACLVACLACAGMATVAAKTGQDTAVQTRRASTEKPATPGRKAPARRSPAKAGTKPRKRPPCNARCKASTKPASTCDCVCRGKTHGKGMTRAGLQSVDMQLQEKSAVRRQKAAAKPKAAS